MMLETVVHIYNDVQQAPHTLISEFDIDSRG